MKGSFFRSAAIVSLSIFSSRVLGLVRDVVIASSFGAGPLTDAFFVAFRIPNMLRRIFAEGAFSSAFTPAFSKKLKESKDKAWKLASEAFTVLVIFLTVTVILGEIFAPVVINLVAPGFPPDLTDLSVKLLREMFPYIFLVSLVAFSGGILNSFYRFFAPAFSTVLFNAAIIVSALLLSRKLSVESLALGVIVGGILQLLLQVPFLRDVGFSLHFARRISRETLQVLRNVIPGIFSFAVRQFSMLIDTVIASFLSGGAISYLYYANRLVQLPLGIFAVGISQVLLPRLSQQSNGKDFLKDLKLGITLCSAVVVPSAVGLILFGLPIVDLIFNHGRFSSEDLKLTAQVLCGYSMGIFFFSAEKIVTNAYYSLNNYNLPVKVAGGTLVLNLIADLIFCFPLGLGVAGLALGTSLTSLANLFLISFFLKKRYQIDLIGTLKESFFRYLLYSLSIFPIVILSKSSYSPSLPLTQKALIVLFTVSISALVYLGTLYIFKDPLLRELRRR